MSCGLGVFVLAKNPSARVNQLFFGMMMGAAYWALGEYLLWTAGSAEGLSFWLHVSGFWPVVIAVSVYFILTFTGRWPKEKGISRILQVLLFVPALVLSLAGVFTDLLYTVENIPGIGWVYVPASSLVYFINGFYVIVIMIWATAATVMAYNQADRVRIREQNRLVCAGLICLIICGGNRRGHDGTPAGGGTAVQRFYGLCDGPDMQPGREDTT